MKNKTIAISIILIIVIIAGVFYYFLSENSFFNKQSVKTNFFYPILTAKTIAASLNAMMLNGTIANKNDRRQLFAIYRHMKGIKYFKLVRGNTVSKEFGPGLKQEMPSTRFDRKLLTSKKIMVEFFKKNKHRYLEVGLPLIAKKDAGGIDCLTCHTVKSRTVLGGVEAIYPVK
jgi:methyl-accepting chemotaxis protein